jgi:glycerol uptake facilitator-like aquaporin
LAGNLRAFLAEFLGTFAWVFFAAGAVCTNAVMQGELGRSGVAAAQGLAVAAVFGFFGRLSPGLFNPAFTVGLAAVKRLDWGKAALCLVCQLLGAALAGLFLAAVFRHASINDSMPFLGAATTGPIGFRGATLLEAVLTFFLAIAAYSLYQMESGAATRSLVIGALAATSALVAGPLTGAIMNPARAFGPAVASGYWSQHYIYWFGPLAGALAGMGLSHFVLEKK